MQDDRGIKTHNSKVALSPGEMAGVMKEPRGYFPGAFFRSPPYPCLRYRMFLEAIDKNGGILQRVTSFHRRLQSFILRHRRKTFHIRRIESETFRDLKAIIGIGLVKERRLAKLEMPPGILQV